MLDNDFVHIPARLGAGQKMFANNVEDFSCQPRDIRSKSFVREVVPCLCEIQPNTVLATLRFPAEASWLIFAFPYFLIPAAAATAAGFFAPDLAAAALTAANRFPEPSFGFAMSGLRLKG